MSAESDATDITDRIKFEITCEACDGNGVYCNAPCRYCNGSGKAPTEFGMRLLQFMAEHVHRMISNRDRD
jgi:RecJ-like exonuclease